MRREEIIQEAINSILNCDKSGAEDVARRAVAAGLNPMEVLNDGFSAGIKKVGDLFSRGEKFLPELIRSADVMKAATEVLNTAMNQELAVKDGKILIATVAGDVHDIGKGIVISIIQTRGLEVIDLGRDVPVSTIIEKAVSYHVDIIGTSALLTTTIIEQKKLEDELKRNGLRERFKTIVGGAPATQRWADRIGADAYGEDAADAAVKVVNLLKN